MKKIRKLSLIQPAFLKSNTATHLVQISAPEGIIQAEPSGEQLIKIKIEIDTPPQELSMNRSSLSFLNRVKSNFTITLPCLQEKFTHFSVAVIKTEWKGETSMIISGTCLTGTG